MAQVKPHSTPHPHQGAPRGCFAHLPGRAVPGKTYAEREGCSTKSMRRRDLPDSWEQPLCPARIFLVGGTKVTQ